MNFTFRPLVMWPGQTTRDRRNSPFRARYADTMERLQRELTHLDARNPVIQIDVTERDIRLDGLPRSDARVQSPGVVVSFESRFGPLRYPCDRFEDWKGNLRAIALALESLRRVDRYGVTRRGEQYTGWKALPPGTAGDAGEAMTLQDAAAFIAGHWSGFAVDDAYESGSEAAELIASDVGAYRRAYRSVALQLHPDRGGPEAEFVTLQKAKRVLDAYHGAT